MITIWQGITIQGLYCYLDMGNDTVMYYNAVMSRTWYIQDTDDSILIAARNSSDTQEEMHKTNRIVFKITTNMKCKQPTVILVLVSLDCMNIFNCI